jgi:hypothetical protein
MLWTRFAPRVAWFAPGLIVACGGASSLSAAPQAAPVGSAAGVAPSGAPAGSAAPDEAYEDPGEAHDPATLTPLFKKDAKPVFPKATIGEHECWQTATLSGDAHKDYDALVARCGTPTGSVEYVTPSFGRLHHLHDKRDTYLVRIHGGYCYRFFGVADGTIKDLDILIERSNGDLVGDDKTNGPVAVIESGKAWCMDADGDYQFGVKIDGVGEGHYAFGVWARPKVPADRR